MNRRSDRKRKAPLRIEDDYFYEDDLFTNPFDYAFISSAYYPVIDTVLSEMGDGFSVHNVSIMRAISSLCPNNGLLKRFQQHLEELKIEMAQLKSL